MDFSNIMKPRLFAESKQEIFLKPNIKCMGAYLLKNNQTITVKEIYYTFFFIFIYVIGL